MKPHLKVYFGRTQSQGGKQDYPVGCLLGLELNLVKAPAENLNIYYLSYLSKEPALQQVTKLAPAGSSADDLPNDRDLLESFDLSR